jgi:8-oxo-dGTP diphosphatase
MRKKKYCYEHPRPSLAADIVIFMRSEGVLRVLLIRRKHGPFRGKWALPGGFMDEGERLIETANRELSEETGLTDVELEPFGFFDRPDRDPRGRTVAVAFHGEVPPERWDVKGGDDAADAHWFPADHPPPLAFDHAVILASAIDARSGFSSKFE